MSPRRPSTAEATAPEVDLQSCPHGAARISLRIGGDVSFVHCPECEAKAWITADGRFLSREEALARIHQA